MVTQAPNNFRRLLPFAQRVKNLVSSRDPSARVLLVRDLLGSYGILIVTRLAEKLEERMRIRVEAMKELGEGLRSLKVHVVAPSDYPEWYRRLVVDYVEV